MKKHIYEVDSNGFISEVYIGEFDKDGILVSPVGDFITVDLPQPLPFHKPNWNGQEWTEGESQEERAEREAQQLLDSLNPTEQELLKAERELETIELLLEMELI